MGKKIVQKMEDLMGRFLRTLVALAIVVTCISLFVDRACAQVTLAWDPHPEAIVSPTVPVAITGFHLWQTKSQGSYNFTGTPAAQFVPGTLTEGTIPKPGLGKYCWILTAFIDETALGNGIIESESSNEVCTVLKPKKPTNLLTKALVALGSRIKGLFTSKSGLKVTYD